MTKQTQGVGFSRQGGATPDPVQSDRETNSVLRLRSGRIASEPPDELSSPRAVDPVPVVQVLVLGVPLSLPEHALRAGLSDLRLATEAHVGLRDYASAVAITLGALANCGAVCLPSAPPARCPDMSRESLRQHRGEHNQ